MKLSLKLPLAFAGALLFLFFSGMFGMTRLSGALQVFEVDVAQTSEAHKVVNDVDHNFAVAIQEWKNTLLRGKTPEDLNKYWPAHEKEMGEVNKSLKELEGLLTSAESKAIYQKLLPSMADATAAYKKAFEEFKAAEFDSAAGDKAARGKDRDAVAQLAELKKVLAKEEDETSKAASAKAASSRNLAYALMVLATALGVVGSIVLSRKIVSPLAQAVGVAEVVASGDLSNPIHAKGTDEVAALMTALQRMQSSLANLVAGVRQGAESVASSSGEIEAGNHDLSARTEQQASVLEETAATMEELSATVKQNADNARQANQLAMNASTVAVKGGEVVEQVVATMKGINESSRKIADIISVIDGIAFQTNILALNAAVEAARAGEQGRGFAVVASEVRSLAGRSAEAAKEIKSLIGASVERVEQGSTLVDQAGVTMTEVVGSIKRVNDIMGEISAASSEQASAVSQVGEAVTHIDQATQQNAALVEQMAAAASGLKGQAHDLVETVAAFKLPAGQGGPRVSPAATHKPVRHVAPRPAMPVHKAPQLAAKAPAPRPVAPKLGSSTPAKVTPAGGDDDWETF
jgi:methyl-accepting chemotaxis protein